MGSRLGSGLVLAAAGALWLASGTEREKPVLSPFGQAGDEAGLHALEARVAEHPTEPRDVRELAQAYLDARAPGLAVSLVERAPTSVRESAAVEHVYARALLDEGRAGDALAVERQVVATCTMVEGTCDTWLVASALRRVDILSELVAHGVEDAAANPEESAVAYMSATREARLAVR
jgi:hypothetical protein